MTYKTGQSQISFAVACTKCLRHLTFIFMHGVEWNLPFLPLQKNQNKTPKPTKKTPSPKTTKPPKQTPQTLPHQTKTQVKKKPTKTTKNQHLSQLSQCAPKYSAVEHPQLPTMILLHCTLYHTAGSWKGQVGWDDSCAVRGFTLEMGYHHFSPCSKERA